MSPLWYLQLIYFLTATFFSVQAVAEFDPITWFSVCSPLLSFPYNFWQALLSPALLYTLHQSHLTAQLSQADLSAACSRSLFIILTSEPDNRCRTIPEVYLLDSTVHLELRMIYLVNCLMFIKVSVGRALMLRWITSLQFWCEKAEQAHKFELVCSLS